MLTLGSFMMLVFRTIIMYFGYLKGANEVNRQCFQQALLLCLLKALYYTGICSYAASYYAQSMLA